MENGRTITNPVLKDRVTFLKTAAETAGECTLVELELAPGGSNALHYHKTFRETFTVSEGRFGIELNGRQETLLPGQTVTAPAGSYHRFFNQSDGRSVCVVELRPGQPAFEDVLRISYRLAQEGKTTATGVPKNPLYTALLFEMADTYRPGLLYRLATPILRLLALIAHQTGANRRLRSYTTTQPHNHITTLSPETDP
ncbi:MAG: cupin domain-containing protein [Chloroflexi bacterium]|nr:cupin domain-containing protein [Chloroflexota bacterium]MCI0577252.1 cupin domain-containing protein [Chloroflexota bacterium]MCI0646733.1 cupin domain-containing protein [Chloroflexota bacterium]MCI0731367.1 cupin domain-containing protein [Chloroflexota bacterium]